MLGADRWCGRLSAPSTGERDSAVDARRLPDMVSRGRSVVSGSGHFREPGLAQGIPAPE